MTKIKYYAKISQLSNKQEVCTLKVIKTKRYRKKIEKSKDIPLLERLIMFSMSFRQEIGFQKTGLTETERVMILKHSEFIEGLLRHALYRENIKYRNNGFHPQLTWSEHVDRGIDRLQNLPKFFLQKVNIEDSLHKEEKQLIKISSGYVQTLLDKAVARATATKRAEDLLISKTKKKAVVWEKKHIGEIVFYTNNYFYLGIWPKEMKERKNLPKKLQEKK